MKKASKKHHEMTVRALAAVVGRSKSTVSEWVNRPDWKWGTPPWPDSIVADVKEWMHLLRNYSGDTGNIDIAAENTWLRNILEHLTGMTPEEYAASEAARLRARADEVTVNS